MEPPKHPGLQSAPEEPNSAEVRGESQADLDRLFADCVDLAVEELRKQRSFAPFMLVIDKGGRRSARFGAHADEMQSKTHIRDALHLPDDQGRIMACAVALDVTVRDSGDAIEVQLEHIEGTAVDVVMPYVLKNDDVDVQTQSATASTSTYRLWGGSLNL